MVNGTSWVGLGWRPRKLNSTCRNFPLLQQQKPSEQLVKASSVSQNSKLPASEPEPASESEPEPSTEHTAAEKAPNAEPGIKKHLNIIRIWKFFKLLVS